MRNFGDVSIDTAYVIGLPIPAPVAARYGRGGGVPPAAPLLVAFIEAGAVALMSFLILSARGRRK